MEEIRIYYLKEKTKFTNPQLGSAVFIEKKLGDWREALEKLSKTGYKDYDVCGIDPCNGFGVHRVWSKKGFAAYVVKLPLLAAMREIVYVCTALANMMAIDSSPDCATFNQPMAPRSAQFVYDELMKILECKDLPKEKLQEFGESLMADDKED